MSEKVNKSRALELMAEGWELGVDRSCYGSFWLQKGGVGRGGETKYMGANTGMALLRSGRLRLLESKWHTDSYRLKTVQEGG